jgi:hypothetical protein
MTTNKMIVTNMFIFGVSVPSSSDAQASESALPHADGVTNPFHLLRSVTPFGDVLSFGNLSA